MRQVPEVEAEEGDPPLTSISKKQLEEITK